MTEAGWLSFLLIFLIRPSGSSSRSSRSGQPGTARCSSCRAVPALPPPQLHAALAVAAQQSVALGMRQVPLDCLHQRRQRCTAAKAPAGAQGKGVCDGHCSSDSVQQPQSDAASCRQSRSLSCHTHVSQQSIATPTSSSISACAALLQRPVNSCRRQAASSAAAVAKSAGRRRAASSCRER